MNFEGVLGLVNPRNVRKKLSAYPTEAGEISSNTVKMEKSMFENFSPAELLFIKTSVKNKGLKSLARVVLEKHYSIIDDALYPEVKVQLPTLKRGKTLTSIEKTKDNAYFQNEGINIVKEARGNSLYWNNGVQLVELAADSSMRYNKGTQIVKVGNDNSLNFNRGVQYIDNVYARAGSDNEGVQYVRNARGIPLKDNKGLLHVGSFVSGELIRNKGIVVCPDEIEALENNEGVVFCDDIGSEWNNTGQIHKYGDFMKMSGREYSHLIKKYLPGLHVFGK
ncbi:MAG: hypothetical protein V1648_03740 [Candidatus Aenigmatarchaeota archaeon]